MHSKSEEHIFTNNENVLNAKKNLNSIYYCYQNLVKLQNTTYTYNTIEY